MGRADYLEIEKEADNLINHYEVITSKLKDIQSTTSFIDHIDNPEYIRLMNQQDIISNELLKYREMLTDLARGDMSSFAGINSIEELLTKVAFEEIDSPVEPWKQQQEEHNSLLKRNPELLKELLQVDGEIADLGNSRAAMGLEFKEESEYTEDDKMLEQRIESLIERAQQIYSQMV